MKKSDVSKHMRMAALQCDFEGGEKETLKKPALWREYGFNWEQLFHTHAELYTAVFMEEKHGSLLRKYLAKERENGVSVILYLNCHILLMSQEDMFGEWAQKKRDGSLTRLYDTYASCCLNSPWVEFFLKTIESLREYDIAGIFFDGPVRVECHCGHCKEAFRRMFGSEMDDAPQSKITEFTLRTQIEAKKKFHAKVKETNPEWLAYFNESVMHSTCSIGQLREVLDCNDIIGTEGGFQFYSPATMVNIWRCGLAAKSAEAVADGKPTVIFMAADHKCWSWHLHTPAETRLCYMSTLANGASVWYGLHSASSLLKGAAGDAVRELVQFDKKHEKIYRDTSPASEVSLLFSVASEKICATSREETDFYAQGDGGGSGCISNYSEAFNGAAGLLFRSGISFDMATELNIDSIFDHKVLLAPAAACVTPETAEKIRRFVKEGGLLITDAETSLFDESGKRLDDFLLSEVLGVSFCGSLHRRKEFDYFEVEDKELGFEKSEGVRFLPAPHTTLDVAKAEGSRASIKGLLCPALAGRYAGKPQPGEHPFLMANKYGKGWCYYFAGTVFELYKKHAFAHFKKLVGKIIRRHAELDFELLNAPESVEFTIRRNNADGSTIFHIVNYTGGMSRPIDSVVELDNLEIRSEAGFKSARALRSGKKLAIKNGRIMLPRVAEYEVIVAK